MPPKIILEEMISDNEGVSLGNVNNYVKRFKESDDSSSNFNPKKSFTIKNEEDSDESVIPDLPKKRASKASQDPNLLPASLTPENEKGVYVYYYSKFGNLDCDDFDKVSGKVAAAINRLFKTALRPAEAQAKLEEHVRIDDIEIEEDSPTPVVKVSSKPIAKQATPVTVKIDLPEAAYKYVKDLEPMTPDQLDLVRFVEPEAVCFSSKDGSFYLALNPKFSDSFEKLFNFSPKEELVFALFKEQLGDEHKARKLVLASRFLNTPEPSEPKTPALKKNKKS